MKPTKPALQKRFLATAAMVSGAETRSMFGQYGALIADRMFAGTFEDLVVMRLPEPERLLYMRAFGGRPFEPMPGRPMKEYVAAPADVLHDDATLLAWMKRAAAYTKSLPPKKGKGAAKSAAGKASAARGAASKPAPKRVAKPAPAAKKKAAGKRAAAKAKPAAKKKANTGAASSAAKKRAGRRVVRKAAARGR